MINLRVASGDAVNWDCPLNDGLKLWMHILPQHWGQNGFWDIVNNIRSDWKSVWNPKWTMDGEYPSLYGDGSNWTTDTVVKSLVPGPVTVSLWCKYVSGDNSAFQFTVASNRFQAHLPFSSVIYWDYGNQAGNGRLSVAWNAAWTGRRTHFAFVSGGSGGSLKEIYANGINIARNTGTSDQPTGPISSLAIHGNLGGKFRGTIDTFRVYDRVLSPPTIAELYNEDARFSVNTLKVLGPRRTFYFGTAAAPPATVRDMSQLHLGSVSFSHRNILQRGSIGVNS